MSEDHPTQSHAIAQRDAVTGRIVAKGPDAAATITAGNAKELAARRWEKYRRTAASKVMQEAAAIDPSVKTPAEAWGLLVARLFQQIMDSEKPRGEDIRRLGQFIGALSQYDREPGAGKIGTQINQAILQGLTDAQLSALTEAVRAGRNPQQALMEVLTIGSGDSDQEPGAAIDGKVLPPEQGGE